MTTADGGYVIPVRQILSPSDLHAFLHSKTYTLINSFIEDLSGAVEDVPITPDIDTSKVRLAYCRSLILKNVSILVGILDEIDKLVTHNPPEETKSRFGNVAFRSFYDELATVFLSKASLNIENE